MTRLDLPSLASSRVGACPFVEPDVSWNAPGTRRLSATYAAGSNQSSVGTFGSVITTDRTGVDRARLFWPVVAIQTVAFAAIAGVSLHRSSLVVDEAFTATLIRTPSSVFWHTITDREANQSLHVILLRLLRGFGDSE